MKDFLPNDPEHPSGNGAERSKDNGDERPRRNGGHHSNGGDHSKGNGGEHESAHEAYRDPAMIEGTARTLAGLVGPWAGARKPDPAAVPAAGTTDDRTATPVVSRRGGRPLNALLSNLFDFDRSPTPGEIVFFKAFELFVAVAAMNLAWKWGFYTLHIADVVLPLGVARYVDLGFMYGNAVPVLNAMWISTLLFAGYFRLWRFAYLGAFLLLHLQYAARFSLGEIPHSSNMLGMALLGLALAMLVFRDDVRRRRFTLGFTYFFMGLGYTLAGISKLVATGLAWSDGRHLWMWVHEKAVDQFAKTGYLEFNGLQELVLGSPTIATLFLSIGLLTELTAFLMWWKRFRTPVMLAVLALHIGIYLIMNILFKLSVYELILLALPWSAWLNWVSCHTRLLRPVERLSARFA